MISHMQPSSTRTRRFACEAVDMDWARDSTGISDSDYRNVYKYEEKPTTVVRMTSGDTEPSIVTLKSEEDWNAWLQSEERPRVDGSKSGYVLIISKRSGEPSFSTPSRVGSGKWLETYKQEVPSRSRAQKTLTFASLAEKDATNGKFQRSALGSGKRGIRTLPFSENVFRLITKNFYTHGSISRVISRADVQTFSYSEVEMTDDQNSPALAEVYNCRTSNAWDMDLALTTTYFPHCGLTFAILFGCPLSVEEEIVSRLSFATAEASHPLLLLGILVELERSRHVHVVEAMIDELESKIFELDFQPEETERSQTSGLERRNKEKRTAYLDTAYLRNGLIGWSTQLSKMVQRVEYLESEIFFSGSSPPRTENSTKGGKIHRARTMLMMQPGNHEEENSLDEIGSLGSESDLETYPARQNCASEHCKQEMRKAGRKIKDRLEAIIDEYEEKIRDCTMRVDGMAMATQWAQGETNVEIALAAGRDSRHMRSIALLTMVFLPGTFLASFFSMTFFNWSASDGEGQVSAYIWIYVLVTLCFTLATVGTWYYFVIWRQSRLNKEKSDEDDLDI
ncbi:hypothetical protein BKA64DRAFT_685465 [Cadophora sp. MPI-SDFR-AT-0126]|nr:hypothetical protein BKA64DRAFT_685465 [Leotiomycetes sp. MPI-SDFR-AT-0126]